MIWWQRFIWLLFCHWNQIDGKKKKAIGAALVIEVCVSLLQAVNPTWLISGMGMTLMTMAFYLTLENPDILRAELTEQKMSMFYLKSQVNPHFLYNTLDTIRIQAVGQRIEGDANDKLFFRPLKNRPRSLGANGRLTAIIRHIIGEY